MDPVGEHARQRERLRKSLERLDRATCTDEIVRSAPAELVMACGFSRAMISAVRGSRWVPQQLFTLDVLDPAAESFRDYVASDAEIPLAHLLAETDVVRRRDAILVPPEMVATRAFKPIIELARSPAYVVAPVVVERRTVGFVHADRVGQDKLVDESDRRLVRAFAEDLAVMHQRIRWEHRLAERGRLITSHLERAARTLRRLEQDAGGWLPVAGHDDDPAPAGPGAQRDPRLTEREWEVLSHVADGATNRVIAARMSVSEDTVKSHMRSVLRKLRVTSRGAAAARYVTLGRRPS